MAGTGAGYDLSVTTFSPDGRVFQVDYAHKAVESTGTALAICCKDGVLFAVENTKERGKMLVEGTCKRTYPVHKRAGITFAGRAPDARQIVLRAQQESKSFISAYDEEIPPNILAERLGMFMHAYTLYWSVRPFGCSVLLGVVDPETKEPSLFCIEPSGLAFKYRGTAVGKGKQAAKTEIEKLLGGTDDVTCKGCLTQVAKILHKVHDEKDKEFELEMYWISAESGYQYQAVPKDLITKAEAEAKALIEAEEE